MIKVRLKKKGDCMFRRNGPLLWLKWREKKDVTMLTTIHEAVMVEMGKCDALGEKIEKPKPVYYYCGTMGGVYLSDQLLHYFSFLRKSTKWSRKLLIHMLNLVILNAYILNKHYGCEKLTHDEYREKIVKYLLAEGLKNYNIPLPPVISMRIGKDHKDEHDNKQLCEWHFPTHIPKGEERKMEKSSSYWCEDCGKALCVVPCFKIYHTQADYKLHAKNFRKGVYVFEVEGVKIKLTPHDFT